MKTLKNPFLTVSILLILIASPVFSQNQTDVSNITIGKSYKIVLFDDTEILGKIVAADSVTISVLTENGSKVIIPKNNILYFSTDMHPSKFSFQLALLGGVSFMSNNEGYYGGGGYYNGTRKGPNADISLTYFMSDVKALKFDFGYTFLKANYDREYYSYSYYDPQHQPSTSGGDIGMYSFKSNMLFGRFIPEERLQLSGSVGLGVHIDAVQEITTIDWSKSYPDTGTWRQYIYNHPAQNNVYAVISLGASFGYLFSKHLGARVDAEFDMITSSGFWFFGGGRNYFPVRAGIFYSF